MTKTTSVKMSAKENKSAANGSHAHNDSLSSTLETLATHHDKTSEMKSAVRVFLAAENLMEIRRIRALLTADPDIVIIGYATSASELEVAIHLRPAIDVLVTDVSLHDCDVTPLIYQATKSMPDLNVLCLTLSKEEDDVFRAIQNGATGYILRDAGEDLAGSIRLIHMGGSPVSPTVARCVLRTLFVRAHGDETQGNTGADPELLSAREQEVLNLLAKGISFSEIAKVLQISTHTVTAHIKKIYKKLQVHSRGEAVYEAKCLGLLRD